MATSGQEDKVMQDGDEADAKGSAATQRPRGERPVITPSRQQHEWNLGVAPDAEWLETDGLGGYASGCVDGIRRRRYHALLLAATTPPTGRVALVSGFDAWVDVGENSYPLTSQFYAPGTVHPMGVEHISAFHAETWPHWTFDLGNGITIDHELFAVHDVPAVALRWRLRGGHGNSAVMMRLRPFLAGRDYHSASRETEEFDYTATTGNHLVTWRPLPNMPRILSRTNAEYRHDPLWFRNFIYEIETERGLDDVEDLASPGEYTFDLSREDAVWILAADLPGAEWLAGEDVAEPVSMFGEFSERENERRARFVTDLHRSADAYLVRRGEGKTIVAGYPWFTDWGRDTFISMRGLCLATGRLDEARQILVEWASCVSEGMLPNRFPDEGDTPEYNSVDASLWYIVAVRDYLDAARRAGMDPGEADREALLYAVDAIMLGYFGGTRYGIHCDVDGLLRVGIPGESQLTWMDARSNEHAVTPRVGKPVEIEALWINALAFVADRPTPTFRWRDVLERARASFAEKFWNDAGGYLFDVVDVDHEPGANDATLRPNQLLAVGGLPVAALMGERARRVVDMVGHRLMTPLGPRTLAPGSPQYKACYKGDRPTRDACYHQGPVWPWLMGPFVDAWVRVRGGTPEAKRQARIRFVEPLMRHLGAAGLGHVSELADAEPPYAPRGCPFQAWSVGELIRILLQVLAEREDSRDAVKHAPAHQVARAAG